MRNLSNVQGTIGKIIRDNMTAISSIGTQRELVTFCEDLLKDSNNADKDNFLSILKSKKGLMKAQEYVCNYMLKGDGLGVL